MITEKYDITDLIFYNRVRDNNIETQQKNKLKYDIISFSLTFFVCSFLLEYIFLEKN